MSASGYGVAIASSTALAAEAGATVAREGGNAVDAAIAAAWVGAIAEPGICAPGCGGFVTVWPPDDEPAAIDGYIAMPGRGLPPSAFGSGTREIFIEYGGGVSMHVGYGSVGTPGGPAALDLASRRFGVLPWTEVLGPAIELARSGFPLTSPARHYLEYSGTAVFGWHPDSHAALHNPDGSLKAVGEIIHVACLADSLDRIRREGAADLYTGDLADAIARDMEANGGLITREDLAEYRPIVRPALMDRIGAFRVATNPPPAIGGEVLAALLRQLGDVPKTDEWSEEDIEHLVDVQARVLGHRRADFDLREDVLEGLADLRAAFRSPSTVHTSAVDDSGCGCAITLSAGYGSGVMIPGTGLWMNNCLGEVELNRRGLHSWPVGARLVSNMAPTVARRNGDEVLAIGSPGADRITTAILQVLANHANAGMPLDRAVRHPRLHVEDTADGPRVAAEPGLPEPPGGLPWRHFDGLSMYFGGVGAASWSTEGGFHVAADPRRNGGTAVVD